MSHSTAPAFFWSRRTPTTPSRNRFQVLISWLLYSLSAFRHQQRAVLSDMVVSNAVY